MQIFIVILRWVYTVSLILLPVGLILGVLGLIRLGAKGDENKKRSGKKFLLIAASILAVLFISGILSPILQK